MIAGRAHIPGESLNPKRVVFLGLIVAAPLFIVLQVNSCYASEYANYTSDKYRIQFQYPSNWTVTEKAWIFDERSDIEIADPIPGGANIAIMYKPPSHTLYSSEFRVHVYQLFEDIVYDREYERYWIEQPRFMLIDGNETGTFVFTHKDKHDENAITWEAQVWLVDKPDHFYAIFFLVRTDPAKAFYGHSNFTPENIEIRDKFIKSIKFL